MVVDSLGNAKIYRPLGARIAAALDYLQRTDFSGLPAGRQELDGDNMFALVQDYTSKREGEGRWEHHRRYIDLQYVASGIERLGYAPVPSLKAEPFDTSKDIAFLTGSGDFVTLPAGHFVLLWPGDAHMPGLAAGSPGPVRKVVVKIAVAQG
jgi:YhcH/YjgK/YiaL family protein